MVASITEPFCGDCDRLRVTAEGRAYSCVFAAAGDGLDLRPWLSGDRSSDALEQVLRQFWSQRADRYSEERQQGLNPAAPRRLESSGHAEMAYLGG
ncbi:MAG: hypothetical protein ACK55I_45195 [bacterium]